MSKRIDNKELKSLLDVGKERGYLLYDEVGDVLPKDIQSAKELDKLFDRITKAGIEVIDSDQQFEPVQTKVPDKNQKPDETPREALEKTNDPVRMLSLIHI